MPVSPDSKANAIEEAFQCATPSTSECLESRNIYRKEQRTCDNEIISSAMKSSRSVRKMLLPMLTGDKLALCRCLQVPAGALGYHETIGIIPQGSIQELMTRLNS